MISGSLFKVLRPVLLVLIIAAITSNVLAVRADMYIFAVSDTGKGIPARLVVDVTPGTGKVSITLNSVVGEDTQISITNAIKAAAREANVDFYRYDYTVSIESGAEYVSGPSAGLPIAIATYYALKNMDVPDTVSATGTIDEDGEVGPVGGIYEKAKAAASVGVKVLLIPHGERYVEIPKEEEIEPGIVIPSTGTVDIVKVAKKEWNMDVYEVKTLREALEILEGNRPPVEVNEGQEKIPEVNFVPSPASVTQSRAFGSIVKDLISELREEVNKDCSNPQEGYEEVKKSAQSYLERAEIAYEYGYYYTAGNYAFLGLTLIGAYNEICEHPSMMNLDSLAARKYVEDLSNDLQELRSEAEKIPLTRNNYEWLGGARERIIRAEYTLENLSPSPLAALRDLKSVEYWIQSAKRMLEEANTSGALEQNISDIIREAAENEIITAEDLLYKVNSKAASQRIEWAKEAYERGWYMAAYSEAALAIGEIVANNTRDSEVDIKVKNLIEDTDECKGMWAELYRNHGLYYKQAADAYRKNGDKDKELSMMRTALTMLEAAHEFSVLSRVIPTPRIKVVKRPLGGPVNPEQNMVLGIILVIVAVFLLLVSIKPKKEVNPEKKRIVKEIEVLRRVRKILEHHADLEIAQKEIKHIDREIERLKKKIERGEPSPQRRSSRRGRGKRR